MPRKKKKKKPPSRAIHLQDSPSPQAKDNKGKITPVKIYMTEADVPVATKLTFFMQNGNVIKVHVNDALPKPPQLSLWNCTPNCSVGLTDKLCKALCRFDYSFKCRYKACLSKMENGNLQFVFGHNDRDGALHMAKNHEIIKDMVEKLLQQTDVEMTGICMEVVIPAPVKSPISRSSQQQRKEQEGRSDDIAQRPDNSDEKETSAIGDSKANITITGVDGTATVSRSNVAGIQFVENLYQVQGDVRLENPRTADPREQSTSLKDGDEMRGRSEEKTNKNTCKSEWKVETKPDKNVLNVEPLSMVRDLLCTVMNKIQGIFSAEWKEVRSGSLVFVFEHKSKEDALQMIRRHVEVEHLILDCLRQLDSEVQDITLHIRLQDLGLSERKGDITEYSPVKRKAIISDSLSPEKDYQSADTSQTSSGGRMWKLQQKITKGDEQDLYLGTNDIFRPDMKQIGNSLFEIRSYFIKKDSHSIAPTKLRTPLAQLKERLIEHIESHVRFDPHTNEVIDVPNPKAGPCFMFVSHSLSVALDFYTSPRPSNTVCDVFLALPTQSVIVLSLVGGDEDSPEAVAYSMSVARGVIETLSRFTDEDINSIHGVIRTSLLEDAVGFKNRLKKLAKESSRFVTKNSLGMTPSRYEKVLAAFWAGVAETKSVLKEETGDTDGDCLRFLTKEQCITLVENINSKNVEVKCVPGSGATTLMLEVARRLNRLGDTLLVCRSRQERDRLRSVYPSVIAAEDLSMVDMSSCVNIVDETNTVVAQTSGQHWQFQTYLTDIKELKYQMFQAEMEIERMEKQIDVLSNEYWKERIEYYLRDFSVLKMFSFKLGSTGAISAHEVRHNLEYKPSPLRTSKGQNAPLGDLKHLSASQEAWLSDLHDGLRQRENLVPLLRSVIIQDKMRQIYQGLKHVLLAKASGTKKRTESDQSFDMVGHAESPDIQHQMASGTKDRTEKKHTESKQSRAKTIIQDKARQIYQGFKNVPRKALGTKKRTEKKHTESKQSRARVGYAASPDIQHQMEMVHIEPENTGKESDTPTVREEGGQIDEMETMVEDTDGKDLESREDEIKTLNQDLDNLLKDRACRNGQLHKLYTVELQAAVEYLARHKGDLSMLDIEIQGLQVFQGLPDRQESTFTGHVTGTSAVSTVGHEEIGEEVGPSKRKRRKLDISGSATPPSHNTNTGRDKGQRHTRAPGLINQLRQYQQGRLTEKHLSTITMKITRDDELQLKELMANNDCLEKDFGSTVHVVGLTRRPLLVSCPTLHLDADRANTTWCHVTPDGVLVNRPPDTWDEGKDRLRMYWGTYSSPIPLPPPSSTLTPLPTTPRYWETETRVRVGGERTVIVLEMGVCEAGQVDSEILVSLQPRSWSVHVGSCHTHQERFCTRVYREGKEGECHQDTMSPTPGTQDTLHFGIVLDVGRGRVAFTDLDRQVVLDKFNVEFREPLVPMFSTGWKSEFSGNTSSMRLISGEDINMTDTKKALIYQALN